MSIHLLPYKKITPWHSEGPPKIMKVNFYVISDLYLFRHLGLFIE